MNTQDLPKKLRMLLYGKVNSDGLTQQFERVLELCGCEYGDVQIVENDDVILVDIPNCIQYVKTKGPGSRLYESIPPDSLLRRNGNGRRKNFDTKSESECRAIRLQMQSA